MDSFLNHQMDVKLYQEMGREWYRLFREDNVTKILTIEASGIGIACVAALEFDVPVIFAKKSKTKNIAGEVYSTTVTSFTHGNVNTVIVSKKFLNPGDRVLIIDDFLANGAAMLGLIDLVRQAGATLVGCGIAVERPSSPADSGCGRWGSGWNPWPGCPGWGMAWWNLSTEPHTKYKPGLLHHLQQPRLFFISPYNP